MARDLADKRAFERVRSGAMPDLAWNKRWWEEEYRWVTGGEEWSESWGGSEAQWFGSIYPRIHRLLPVDRVLEIAPGFGRWTKFLMPLTRREYVGVDISSECVTRCRDIFRKVKRARFYTNDGLSLDMVRDATFDFVFSFDSLVHAEIDVLEAYVPQVLRKLRAGGAAFLHHANWLAAGEADNPHGRAVSVTADNVRQLVERSGGVMLLQETINWGTNACIDCFSVFGRSDGHRAPDRIDIHNPHFMTEASIIRDVQSAYSRLAPSGPA
jgi:SAM-dependent methyltransferase